MNTNTSRKSILGACLAIAGGVVLADYDDYVRIDSPYGESFGDSPLNYQEAKPTKYNASKQTDCYYWSDHLAPANASPSAKYYLNGSYRGAVTVSSATLYASGVRHAVWPTAELRLGPSCVIKWKWTGGNACSYEFPSLVTMSGAILSFDNDANVAEIRGALTVNGTLKINPGAVTESDETGFRFASRLIGDAGATVSVLTRNANGYIYRGKVELVGDNSAYLGAVSVNSNSLFVGASGLESGKVVASNVAWIGPRAGFDARVVLNDLTMDASSILCLNPTNVLVVTGSFVHGGTRLKVRIDGTAPDAVNLLPTEELVVPLLELTADQWKLDDFEIDSRLDFKRCPGARYDVVKNESIQTLSLIIPPCAKLLRGGVSNAGWNGKAKDSPFYGTAKYGEEYYWSDHQVPQPGKAYVIDGTTVSAAYLPELEDNEYWTFGGDILQTVGATATIGFNNANSALSVDDLRFANTKSSRIEGWRPDAEDKIIGSTLSVDSPKLEVQFRGRVKMVVTSAIRGAGTIDYVCTASPTNATTSVTQAKAWSRSTFVPLGDNTAFTGDFIAHAQSKVSVAYCGFDFPYEETCATVLVSGNSGLGGAIETFKYNSVTFCDYSVLAVTNSVTLSSANRGLFIGGSTQNQVINVARVNVVNDADVLELGMPITYDGELRKEGAGVLALGARPRFTKDNTLADDTVPTAGKNLLSVRQGYIMARNTDAIKNLAVTFSADTGIVVDAAASGDIRDFGFKEVPQSLVVEDVICVSAVNVTQDTAFESAICTLPKSTTLTKDSFRPLKVGKMRGVVSSRDNSDDTVTFLVNYAPTGLLLLFR